MIVPRGYECLRTPSAIHIDGDIGKPEWAAAPWTEDFIDISTDVVPRYRTRAKMLWDEEYFYIAAEMEEPHVWATLTEHDSVIFHDNDFEIFIDPDGDNHQYYEIEVNAFNTTWDLRLVKPYRDGGPALNEWECEGMKTAVRVLGTINDPSDRDLGWTLEMALPWRALAEFANCPSPPRPGDQWRVNFSRVQWTDFEAGRIQKQEGLPEDNWVWSPQGVIDMHRPEMWGLVRFVDELSGQPVRDPHQEARDLLHRVYWHFRDTGELLDGVPGLDAEKSEEGFMARYKGCAIRQDSLFTTPES